jgi:D-sedoheptulose 7-phosphate isomerase
VAFTASGNSANALAALRCARAAGAKTLCVTGRDGGKARGLADVCVRVPGTSRFPGQTGANDNNFHIEDCFMKVSHILTGLLWLKVNGSRGAR